VAGADFELVIRFIFASVGLSALLAQSAVAFSVIRYVGATYLIYLGIKAPWSRVGFAVSNKAAQVGLKSVFVQGVTSNVLNPKVALCFLAFLPQPVDPVAGGAAMQPLALGLTLTLLTWVVFSALGYFSRGLGNWLRSRPGYANALRWLMDDVLVEFGRRLALSDR
jgi:threonine/homoserine/homoserine lactone efflux protein